MLEYCEHLNIQEFPECVICKRLPSEDHHVDPNKSPCDALTFAHLRRLIKPFNGLTSQVAALGICGEYGEMLDEVDRLTVRRTDNIHDLSKEIGDILVYLFLYLNTTKIEWWLKEEVVNGRPIDEHNAGTLLSGVRDCLRLAELEKKASFTAERPLTMIAGLWTGIYSSINSIAKVYRLSLDVIARNILKDNYLRYGIKVFEGCTENKDPK